MIGWIIGIAVTWVLLFIAIWYFMAGAKKIGEVYDRTTRDFIQCLQLEAERRSVAFGAPDTESTGDDRELLASSSGASEEIRRSNSDRRARGDYACHG